MKRVVLIGTLLVAMAALSNGIAAMSRSYVPLQGETDPALQMFRRAVTVADIDTISFVTQLLGCLTPEMYGAKGDGKADDTKALREAIYQSNKQNKVLFFQSGKKYKVTGTLNYYDGKYHDYCLNMIGSIPVKKGSYAPTSWGGIQVSDGVSLFKNAQISGSIKSMCFTGKRSDNIKFFDTCSCAGLVLTQCNISNFGVIFFDTNLHKLTQITSNTFLTVFYFSKNEKTSSGMTDSTISFNYINGGKEKKDNACFEWGSYNGALVTNNFIDYYRTIYYPVVVKKQTFVGPVSSNNHYQVFRYFYAATANIQSMTFYSSGDAFNWNDPASLDILQDYEPFTYTGKDGKIYEIPPYVAICKASWKTTIKAAKIERNMRSLVFVAGSLTEYKDNVFDVEFIGNNPNAQGQISYRKGNSNKLYNNGSYKSNSMKISGIVEPVESLPKLSIGWSEATNGRTVLFDGKIYTAVNVNEGGKWKAVWIDAKGDVAQ